MATHPSEEEIQARAREIELTTPDEYGPGYARYLAEREMTRESLSKHYGSRPDAEPGTLGDGDDLSGGSSQEEVPEG